MSAYRQDAKKGRGAKLLEWRASNAGRMPKATAAH